MEQQITFQLHKGIDEKTGRLCNTEEACMCNILPYQVEVGTLLQLPDVSRYEYKLVYYNRERKEQYLYTYDYELEQNWSTYVGVLPIANQEEQYVFERAGYVRITINRVDGQTLTEQDKAFCEREMVLRTEDSVLEKVKEERSILKQPEVQKEIVRTRIRVKDILAEIYRKDENARPLCVTLLADTHHTINDIWTDTMDTIRSVQKELPMDGVIHLGDLTDGMLGKAYCRELSRQVLDDLSSTGLPVYLTIGNHDANDFRNNAEVLSAEEQYAYYLKDISAEGKKENQLWYYQDFNDRKLRILFLHSFEPKETNRYGFSMEEVVWVKKVLEELPEDYRVLICSHDAPLARLDYWASEIRNGEKLMEVLEGWHEQHGRRIMAYLHGHSHTDFIYRERSFPIIAIGCSKCEYFADKKPEGAHTASRYPGEVTQELWNTMIIDTVGNTIDLVRFGAGMDRHIPQTYQTKIWGHRGASGYAPENTLEAFQLAVEMGVDGVELDVQLTKDRQIVVIHDEVIERVSDGAGKVADYTLAELKRYRFNRTHPEYEEAKIPTLEEVLDLLKPTNLTINIELKTGVNFYEGIEALVLKLVKEKGMEDRIIYSSFNHQSMLRIKGLRPKAKVGFLYCDGIQNAPNYATQYHAQALHPSLSNMQYPCFMETCQEKGIEVNVWTVDQKQDMEKMCNMGVHAIITNYPDVGVDVVKSNIKNEEEVSKSLKILKIKDCQKILDTQIEGKKEHSRTLHICGVIYGKIRKVFVEIDKIVQKAAGK